MLQESRNLVAEAIEALRAHRRADAEALLADALVLDRGNAKAWMLQARLAKTPEQQRQQLQRARALVPADEEVRVALRALDHSGGPAAFQKLVARARACDGQPNKALAAWKAVLDFDPANEEALTAMLPSLTEMGRQKLARRLLAQALKKNPHNESLAVYYADMLAEDGRWDDAAAVLEWVPPGRLHTAQAYARLGKLYGAMGRSKEARAAFAEAAALPGASPLDYYQLRKLHEQAGDDDGAIAAYRHVVDEAWGTAEAAHAEKRLRVLSPYLPRSVADSWPFILREAAGWVFLIGLMAAFDSGLRLVGMRAAGVVAIAMSTLGGLFWAIGGITHSTLNLLGERPIGEEWRQGLRIAAGVLLLGAVVLSLSNGLGNAVEYFIAGMSGPR